MIHTLQVLAISFLVAAAGSILLVSNLPPLIPAETASVQIMIVCIVYVLSGGLHAARKAAISAAAAVIKIFCIYFIVKAAGVTTVALALLVFAFHLEAFYFIPLHYGVILALTALRVTMVSSSPHTAWDTPVGPVGTLWVSVIAALAAAGAFTGCLISRLVELSSRRAESMERLEEAVRNLTETNTAYQTYATYIEENSKEAERNRLTREIHDIVGYSMTNLLMIVQAALYSDNQDQVTELLQKAQTHINASMQEVRASLRRLRSTQKKALHGVDLIRHLTANFSRVTGIKVILDVIAFPRNISQETEKILYRMLQESMTNSFRHGKATEIDVTFQVHRNVLFVKIRDNGRGKQAQAAGGSLAPGQGLSEGIGLKGMRERTEETGGTLTTVSGKDGFTVFARIPYHTEA